MPLPLLLPDPPPWGDLVARVVEHDVGPGSPSRPNFATIGRIGNPEKWILLKTSHGLFGRLDFQGRKMMLEELTFQGRGSELRPHRLRNEIYVNGESLNH